MTDWKADESKYLFQNYGRQPIVLERGKGTKVWDTDGNEYLDFVGGLAVTAIGHAPDSVVKAVAQQTSDLIHVSNLYYTKPMVELAKLLVENSCLDRVFFCNSGAEANEGVIKLARRWGYDTKDGAFEIIATENGFHGRTTGALAATGTKRYRDPFEPLAGGFSHVPWADLDAIKAATTEKTVAVMVEPIQGEGGVNMPGEGYLKGIRDWCDENNILLILDEIQTGIGRTGTMWAHEQEGIEPDIMSIAKALASGIPIGAFLATEEVAAHLIPGDHGSTFGASPVACAAGVATLREILDNDVLAAGKRASDKLVGRLRSMEDRFKVVTEVRGRGMLLAIGLDADISGDIVTQCRDKGLLVNNVRPDAIRFMPPLTVSDEEIDRASDILEEVLSGF